MGCGSSKRVFGGEPSASTAKEAPSAGLAAYHAVKELEKKTTSLPPETAEGRAAMAACDAAFEVLERSIREALAAKEAAGATLGLDEAVRILGESNYLQRLAEARRPTRRFQGSWLAFDFPDNGHWRVAQDDRTGLVRVEPVRTILGVSFIFSFAPMRSDVDSVGYAKLFRANLARVFEALPRHIDAETSVLTWAQSELVPRSEAALGDVATCEWYIDSTNTRAGAGTTAARQLEVHGMRRDAARTPLGHRTFSLNAQMSGGRETFQALEPVFRDIIRSATVEPSALIEKKLGVFWGRAEASLRALPSDEARDSDPDAPAAAKEDDVAQAS